jgi:hypothetical protein
VPDANLLSRRCDMNLADIIEAVVALVTSLGLLPFVAAAAVIAVAGSLYRRARR